MLSRYNRTVIQAKRYLAGDGSNGDDALSALQECRDEDLLNPQQKVVIDDLVTKVQAKLLQDLQKIQSKSL